MYSPRKGKEDQEAPPAPIAVIQIEGCRPFAAGTRLPRPHRIQGSDYW